MHGESCICLGHMIDVSASAEQVHLIQKPAGLSLDYGCFRSGFVRHQLNARSQTQAATSMRLTMPDSINMLLCRKIATFSVELHCAMSLLITSELAHLALSAAVARLKHCCSTFFAAKASST